MKIIVKNKPSEIEEIITKKGQKNSLESFPRENFNLATWLYLMRKE